MNYFVVSWLWSYIFGRMSFVQQMRLNSVFPSSGVLQGSILGPFPYSLLISDLPFLFTCPHNLYADDLKLFSIVDSPIELNHLQLNHDI